MLILTACLKMMFQKKLYMWFLVMTIIIFLIWSKGIILNATFSIDHVVFCIYASCNGFISFEEGGLS